MANSWIDLSSGGIPTYATASLFPVSASNGAQAIDLSTDTLYIFNTGSMTWIPVATPGAAIAIDALNGDVGATGPGVVPATINANVVTNSKLSQMAANTIKGNNTAGLANAADLTVAQVKTLLNLTGNYITALTGGVTAAGPGSAVASITNLTTAGSVPYVSSSGIVNQDASNFFWNSSNHRLGLGTTGPLSALDVNGNVAVGTYAGTAAAPTNGITVSGQVLIGTSTDVPDFAAHQLAVVGPDGTNVFVVANQPETAIFGAFLGGTEVQFGTISNSAFEIITNNGAGQAVFRQNGSTVLGSFGGGAVNAPNPLPNALQVENTIWEVTDTANSQYADIMAGGGKDFTGASLGFYGLGPTPFSGSASGTSYAANPQSGFAGNFVDFQVAGASKFTIDASGTITSGALAGTGSRAVLADASGTLSAPVSDIRLKKDIIPLASVLSPLQTVEQLNAVAFHWDTKNERVKNFGEGQELGFIAQEVEKIIPHVVRDNADGYKSMSYEKLVPLLVEAIKELSAKIKVLEEKEI